MTLRDLFAVHAMSGLLAGDPASASYVDALAGRAYDIADAMLVERARRGPSENDEPVALDVVVPGAP